MGTSADDLGLLAQITVLTAFKIVRHASFLNDQKGGSSLFRPALGHPSAGCLSGLTQIRLLSHTLPINSAVDFEYLTVSADLKQISYISHDVTEVFSA